MDQIGLLVGAAGAGIAAGITIVARDTLTDTYTGVKKAYRRWRRSHKRTAPGPETVPPETASGPDSTALPANSGQSPILTGNKNVQVGDGNVMNVSETFHGTPGPRFDPDDTGG